MVGEYYNEISNYSSMPDLVAKNSGNWPEPKYKISLVACARWETRYISEWLSYHKSIGIDHVYLYCNDDDPIEFYTQVLPFLEGDNPFVTFIHYPKKGLQFQMYFHFNRKYMPETEWFMFLDIDEFFCIRSFEGAHSFLETFPQDMDALYINWCSFGHNGHKTRPDGSVLLNYTRREDGVTPFTKVIVKSKSFPYREFFWSPARAIQHDCSGLKKMTIYNVIGENIEDYYKSFPESAWSFLHQENRRQTLLNKAFIAHYNIKSDEDFELRVRRGLVGDYAAEKMWGEKTEEERAIHHKYTNAVEDLCLYNYWKNYLTQKAWSTSPFPPTRWPLISAGCFVTQSSTIHNCTREEDAAKLINQSPRGHSQAHTDCEERPWWRIDFGALKVIHEIRLFNRMDGVFERMNHFAFLGSQDGHTGYEFFVRTSDEVFGGLDGSPFIWVSEAGVSTRMLSIELRGEKNYFNLDQVEIYGTNIS